MTVLQIFEEQIRPLPESDRLQMATLILNSVAPAATVDDSTEWSDEDLRDFSAHNWRHMDARLCEDEDAAAG